MNTSVHGTNGSSKSVEKHVEELDIYQCYKRSPYSSLKVSSYFSVYAELLESYRNKEITFVEIGVLNGGSLFMWREYFGSKARIIGVDFNPLAERWREEGFEIHIGNQADPQFWDKFFSEFKEVDVILDDGGHTNEQQIITASKCFSHIKEGGLLIVEDTHTSYFKDFGNPSKYSFVEWSKGLVDNINSRFPAVKVSDLPYKNRVHSVSFFESIVCFKISPGRCAESFVMVNEGINLGAEDFRHEGELLGTLKKFGTKMIKKWSFLKDSKGLRKLKSFIFTHLFWLKAKIQMRKLKKYF